MASEAVFSCPSSIVRLAPFSGAFGTDDFVGDPTGFHNKVAGFWYTQHNNFLAVLPDGHERMVSALYNVYLRYRALLKSGQMTPSNASHLPLLLYRTGEIVTAAAWLDQQSKSN